jgi:hypothetical protein
MRPSACSPTIGAPTAAAESPTADGRSQSRHCRPQRSDQRNRNAVDAHNNRGIVWRDKRAFDYRAMADLRRGDPAESALPPPAMPTAARLAALEGDLEKSLTGLPNKALTLNHGRVLRSRWPNAAGTYRQRGGSSSARSLISTRLCESYRTLSSRILAAGKPTRRSAMSKKRGPIFRGRLVFRQTRMQRCRVLRNKRHAKD